jgi:PAS domain S-box-containing protein
MEEALQTSEANYRTLIEHTLHGIAILQGSPGDTQLVFANPAMTQITGYPAQEIIKFSFTELAAIINEEDRLRFGKAFWDHVQGLTGPPRCEVRVTHKDNTQIWVEVTGTPFEFMGEKSWLVTFVDITAQKRVEAALQASEKQLHTLAENVPGIVYRLHLQKEGQREFLNDRFHHITGFQEKELARGMHCLEALIDSKDHIHIQIEIQQALEEGSSFDVQYSITHKDGSLRQLRERGQVILDETGAPCFLDGVILDQSPSPQ